MQVPADEKGSARPSMRAELTLKGRNLGSQAGVFGLRVAPALGEVERHSCQTCNECGDEHRLLWRDVGRWWRTRGLRSGGYEAHAASWRRWQRSGLLSRERSQAGRRARDRGGILIVDGAEIRMPGDLVVRFRSPAILITDVAFTDIARHYDDFLRRMEGCGFAPGHEPKLQQWRPGRLAFVTA
jgi:hypothetical protein